jgi:hypothetical protein
MSCEGLKIGLTEKEGGEFFSKEAIVIEKES